MNDDKLQQLVDEAIRRPLDAHEQAEWDVALRAKPDQRGVWEADLRLSRFLGNLPAPPVSPGFIQRVLDALPPPATRSGPAIPAALGWLRGWFPRWQVALASLLVVSATLFTLQHRNRLATERETARALLTFTTAIEELPTIDMLRDFDAIFSLPDGPIPSVDDLALALR